MTGAEVQSIYFSPIMYFFYLGTIVVIAGIYYQWAWSKKCRTEVRVLEVQTDGSTITRYAPKDGNVVSLTNPKTSTTRAWPISRVCAVEMDYPGDGFIPSFLQKKIKVVLVDAEDWEPILNRGSYSEKVASPDVVKYLRLLAEQHPAAQRDIEELANNLTTAPTREMVADPATLGNLMRSSVIKALATISDEVAEQFKKITAQLARFAGLNATVIYIGLGLAVALNCFVIYQLMQIAPEMEQVADVGIKVDAIKKSLGIQ